MCGTHRQHIRVSRRVDDRRHGPNDVVPAHCDDIQVTALLRLRVRRLQRSAFVCIRGDSRLHEYNRRGWALIRPQASAPSSVARFLPAILPHRDLYPLRWHRAALEGASHLASPTHPCLLGGHRRPAHAARHPRRIGPNPRSHQRSPSRPQGGIQNPARRYCLPSSRLSARPERTPGGP